MDADVGQSARLALAEGAMLGAAGDEPAAGSCSSGPSPSMASTAGSTGACGAATGADLCARPVGSPSLGCRRTSWSRRRGAHARPGGGRSGTAGTATGSAPRGADEVRRRLRDLDLSDVSRVPPDCTTGSPSSWRSASRRPAGPRARPARGSRAPRAAGGAPRPRPERTEPSSPSRCWPPCRPHRRTAPDRRARSPRAGPQR